MLQDYLLLCSEEEQLQAQTENNTVDSTIKSNVLDLTDQSNVQIGEVLTFGELVNQILADTNKPREEISQQLMAQGKLVDNHLF